MLSLLDFADRYRWLPHRWDVRRSDQTSGTGSGRILTAELASPLWSASVEAARMKTRLADQLTAQLRWLSAPGRTFQWVAPYYRAPRSDPKGLALGAATVTVASVASDRSGLALAGLPAGYALTAGDKLSISYGSAPARQAFLEISTAVTASGAGTTDVFDVFPAVPIGVTAGLSVALTDPWCPCMIVPGTINVGSTDGPIAVGIAFDLVEV
jgi:hypothetical protein